jgi:Raf kinase inhibitor-like YbhB/YbcL family protein
MGIVHAIGHALGGVHAGSEDLASNKVTFGMPKVISVESVAFAANSALPVSCTADGVGLPPPIGWDGVPEGAESIVVICEDPDAPLPKPFVHWIVYGIPATARSIDADSSTTWKVGENSRLSSTFAPVAPPPGHGVHHYHFQVFALDRVLDLPPGLGRHAIVEQMTDHVVGWGEIVGTYERS